MTGELPLWLSIVVSACVVLGALLTAAGCFGLVRLKDFYLRIHAPTMGTSMGGGLILLASAVFFSFASERLIVHELVIFFFVVTLVKTGPAIMNRPL